MCLELRIYIHKHIFIYTIERPPVALPQGELHLPTASPGALRDEQVGLTQALLNFCIHTESWSG